MVIKSIGVQQGIGKEAMELAVNKILGESGLQVKDMGSRHWHLSKANSNGTLELTLEPAKARIWFKVAKNRSNDWIEPIMNELATKLEVELERLQSSSSC